MVNYPRKHKKCSIDVRISVQNQRMETKGVHVQIMQDIYTTHRIHQLLFINVYFTPIFSSPGDTYSIDNEYFFQYPTRMPYLSLYDDLL